MIPTCNVLNIELCTDCYNKLELCCILQHLSSIILRIPRSNCVPWVHNYGRHLGGHLEVDFHENQFMGYSKIPHQNENCRTCFIIFFHFHFISFHLFPHIKYKYIMTYKIQYLKIVGDQWKHKRLV